MTKVYLYGCGGHAKVAAEVAVSLGIKVLGYFEDNQNLLASDPIRIAPGIALYPPGEFPVPSEPLIITIGDNEVRAKIAASLSDARFISLVHPSAIISADSAIDFGTVVFHGSIVQTGTRIGKHAIINTAASVDHDNRLGDFVHISPNATLCGNVSVGTGSQIGAGAVVLPGVSVGEWAIVGAGAVVTKDVPDYTTVVGNPARPIRRN